ncbi:nucleotidyltransferase domain-containing protein [Sphingobium sp. Sx8-8]|uniref:nucleotidyltransferase domain-containing protein n=1 Tax=Sphingobium sp. Sx8-8 TaxID=2933617 RepID=UPI001F59F921|nr:nucleotidyltransferase domain-containing protein [Sphingobium sp. Sx8-8]
MVRRNDRQYGDITPEEFLRQMYPQANEIVRNGQLDIATAKCAALAAIATYVPDAITAFGFGSAFNNRHRPYSDVDVVVFVQESSSMVNYCFMSEGVAVDLHVVGLDRVDNVIARARKEGICSILSAVSEGVLLLDTADEGPLLRKRMTEAMVMQPLPTMDQERRMLRWMITSQLLDLSQDRPTLQVQAAALTAYAMLIRLYYSVSGGWRDRGKWTIGFGEERHLLLMDLVEGYAVLFSKGEKGAYLRAALRILDLDGGPLCLGQGNRLTFDSELADCR